MFGKKKDAKQNQPIPENTEVSKLTDNSKSGFKKVNEFRKESKVANLTEDANIKGSIKFGQSMRIDGNFEGELTSDSGELVVGKAGNVRATIKVRSAIVEGRVDGNIKASDRVELKQNAHLIGDLQAKTLVVEKGVVFVGKCNVNPEGTKIENQSYKEEIKEGVKEEVKTNRLVNV